MDDVKEVMARKDSRDFPVLGNQGKFVGTCIPETPVECEEKAGDPS